MGIFATKIVNILLVVLAVFFVSFLVTIYASGYLRMQKFTVDNPVHTNQSTTDRPHLLKRAVTAIRSDRNRNVLVIKNRASVDVAVQFNGHIIRSMANIEERI